MPLTRIWSHLKSEIGVNQYGDRYQFSEQASCGHGVSYLS